mmetsp:Transcript_7016/g.8447  ORF Transcript_7016/g.8447 Transcript_7016/m.8447 type:complete len:145 (-) Transcript_7016:32-466(-)|eukprot:CAMPEP_0170469170 /NCGR_PEP_ID=MMETSP0123-20130129/12093_1 /TAXON_ID=182087 /ORGANISM="Favella ehrenbergii, Strain Fehren 1" /LENGTH=144 /DNA_ID=CAMNT_0010735957 /DNA_START=326 /DNA_END=760 /DNA_ORIENTATION=+
MVWGGIAAYGPQTVLYPFSYMGIGAFYAKVTQTMAPFNFLYNVLTTFYLYYAQRLYLYEPDLDHWVAQVEFYVFAGTVWVFFLMLRLAYRRDFEAFYLSDVPQENQIYTDGPGPTETEEVTGEEEAEGESAKKEDEEDSNLIAL